ncbi:DUF924 family protein [Peristeroidobacter agariperforans]|uniref:DUF924 family protein n=1 Tax=Peristeroidobacter agariperforans TaxID=268404 RepID=UPI00101CC4B8|nr:DUF924 family protein [Peristeroidobacter agariperforans]
MSAKDLASKKLPAGWVDDVLHFWFEELSQKEWFSSSARVDEICRARFGDIYAALKADPPDPESAAARTLLAAVIVLDQFPRNIFRKTPDAYATDASALALARHAVESGKDRSLPEMQRHFLYMPFMHSEDLLAQAESVQLFTALGVPDGVKYARHHHDVVERFGRFPYRNSILGRRSTPEELEFLKTEPPLV